MKNIKKVMHVTTFYLLFLVAVIAKWFAIFGVTFLTFSTVQDFVASLKVKKIRKVHVV